VPCHAARAGILPGTGRADGVKEGSVKQAFSWPGSVAALAGMVLAASGMAPALAAQPQPWEITLQPAGSPIMEMIHAFNNGTLIVITVITLFVLALLIGIISGTFSSIFNASPILVDWHLWDERRRARELASQGPARAASRT